MQWWNNFVDWFTSEDGWRILSTIVFPFLAIIVAGFIAAMIGRSATRRLLALHDREQRVSTVAALIGAARRASKWNSLSAPEQQHAEHLAHDADVSIRLLPLPGAAMTADWAAHEIAEMKKNSVSFSFQAEQSLMDFRDRLVEWQSRPSRAKKLFKADLDLWAYESAQEDKGLVEKQQEWAKKQVATETGPVSTAAPESKAISWETPAPSTPAQAAAGYTEPTYTAPAYTEPSRSELIRSEPSHAVSAQPAASVPVQTPAAQRPPERPTYGVPAATTSFSNEPAEATNTGEQEPVEIPSPVSAQTVRQRVLPDNYDEDDLR